MDLAYSVSGLAVGFVVGLSGVGAGALMTPLLILLFGVSPVVAVGTDLLYASATKSAGAWVHWRHGHVDWPLVAWLSAGSLPAALATMATVHALGIEGGRYTAVVTTALGAMVLLTAVSLVLRGRLRSLRLARSSAVGAWLDAHRRSATLATGAVLGVLVALTSVGAGALGMVALVALHGERLPPVTLVGSDIAHAVPLTLVAGLGHAALGTVDAAMLASLLAGSLPGIWLGSHAASRVPPSALRYVLAAVLLLAGGKLIA